MSAATRRRALVVEDDPDVSRGLAVAFTRAGYRVHVASSISVAADVAGEKRCDVVIVDLVLGDGSGLDLIPRLRAANPEGRIVVLSGLLDIDFAVSAMAAGANDAVTKPIAPSALVTRVESGPPIVDLTAGQLRTVNNVKYDAARRALAAARGNITTAARRLGVTRSTLRRWLGKLPLT